MLPDPPTAATGSLVDKLILGTVQLGLDYGINNASGKPAEAEAFAILDLAWDAGIRMLDTAAAYGSAQATIGRWHQRNPGKQFDVISKVSADHGSAKSGKAAEEMVQTLGVDRLWALLHHRPVELLNQPSVLDGMCRLKDRQLTSRVGVSVYSSEEMAAFTKVPEIDLIQLPFNMLDNVQQRGAAISEASSGGKIVHARSVFLQGLFFRPVAFYPEKLRPLGADVARLHAIAAEHDLDIGTMALGYALRQDAISGILIGVDRAAQLEANLSALQREIPQAAMHAIDRIAVRETALLSPVNWQ